MGLTSTGMGSGLDINGIVEALVNSSFSPRQTALNAREATLETEISALGTLKSGMTDFQDALEKLQDVETFDKRKTKLSNDTYVGVETTADAVAGTYNIKVNRLAESQKLGSAAVADADTAVGEGQLTINVGYDSLGAPDPDAQLVIDVSATDTLADIVAKINKSDDNPGVTATIINSDAGPQLVMSSDETGKANEITVAATDVGGTGLSDTFGTMTELVAAEDAELVVDGITITSPSNKVEGAVTGITLDLKEADPSKTTKLVLDLDVDNAKDAVQEFVDQFNAMAQIIEDLSKYDATTEKAGPLQGDALARGITSRMRNLMGSTYDVDGKPTVLSQFGVTFDRYGKLEVDDDKLTDAIENNLDELSQLFASEDTGLAYAMHGAVDNYVGTGGLLDRRNTALEGQKEDISDEREMLNLQMSAYEERLYKQYNAMDTAVYMFNNQAADVASTLASLPGVVPDYGR
ncbi:flagellar filament capping protein FliD [uncultured Ferrimonas sp.]|uniref:flagellar filament capping protein FliD n=1 Tax=uncultured Ferrimonas sp. TaxID=432640 RepID=UPI00262B737C|nr:flagellar filament capping protein FliD [uncultured Ferrimonas sp.]